MKKEFAVFVRVEGQSKGEIKIYGNQCFLEQENGTLDLSPPRDMKIKNIEIDFDFDMDEVMRLGLSKLIEADTERLKAKDWEVDALQKGIEACEQELAKLSKPKAA